VLCFYGSLLTVLIHLFVITVFSWQINNKYDDDDDDDDKNESFCHHFTGPLETDSLTRS